MEVNFYFDTNLKPVDVPYREITGRCQGYKISFEALIVEGINHNLLSVKKITQNNDNVIKFTKNEVNITGTNFELKCQNLNDLYVINIEINRDHIN